MIKLFAIHYKLGKHLFPVKIIAVFIYTKPELPENTTVTPECNSKKEGEAATFECTADGIPTPELSWYNNAGDKLETNGDIEIANKSGSSILTIKKVNSRDAGTYTCKANNSAGTAEALDVLAVLCKYMVQKDKRFQKWNQIGNRLFLICLLGPSFLRYHGRHRVRN